jgi:hypothetical protein
MQFASSIIPTAQKKLIVKQIDREILATIHDLLLRICPDLDPTQGWQVARVTKALYKGMSYLIQQEPEIEKGMLMS